jgi:hypothetical protein
LFFDPDIDAAPEGLKRKGFEDSRIRGEGDWMNSTAPIRTFKDLIVWREAFDLAAEISRLTCEFPGHELHGLSSELRKASWSFLCNIAEEHKRKSTLESIHFLRVS